jgi:GT2 family glycosyltransferase
MSEDRPVTPLFSIIIAAHDAERTLPDTLESIREQTWSDWEAVVVDDGSVDGTAAVARRYAEHDQRLRVLSQAHCGVARARNAGIAVARARWLLPLDADDMLLPDALSAQSRFIDEHPGRHIYSWGILVQRPDGRREPWKTGALPRDIAEFTLPQLLAGNLLTVMTVASAELVDALGGFRDVELEDYDLWLRAFASGARHVHNPEPLAVYRASGSSRNADVDRRELGTAKVLRDLAASGGVSPSVSREARRQARFWEAVVGRRHLEARLLAGDASRARREFWRVRAAYRDRPKWLVGLLLVTVSPRLLARLIPARRPEDTNVTVG